MHFGGVVARWPGFAGALVLYFACVPPVRQVPPPLERAAPAPAGASCSLHAAWRPLQRAALGASAPPLDLQAACWQAKHLWAARWQAALLPACCAACANGLVRGVAAQVSEPLPQSTAGAPAYLCMGRPAPQPDARARAGRAWTWQACCAACRARWRPRRRSRSRCAPGPRCARATGRPCCACTRPATARSARCWRRACGRRGPASRLSTLPWAPCVF